MPSVSRTEQAVETDSSLEDVADRRQLLLVMTLLLMMTTLQALEIMTTMEKDQLLLMTLMVLLQLMTVMLLQLLLMNPMAPLLKNLMVLQLMRLMVPQLMRLLLNILLMPDVDVADLATTVVQLLELTETGQLLEDQLEDVQLKLKDLAENSDPHKTEDLSNNNVVLSLNSSQDVDVVEVLSPSQFLTEVH